MRIDLADTRFTFDNKPQDIPTRKWKRTLVNAGGIFSTRIDQADVLVTDDPSWGRADSAVRRGLPMITTEQFVELLEAGSITLESAYDEGDATLDELIGEVRSALDGVEQDRAWEVIVRTIERCTIEQRPALVEYVDAQLARWRPEHMRHLTGIPMMITPAPGDQRLQEDSWSFDERVTPGEVRVAPKEWLAQMVQEVDDPRWRLVYGIANVLSLSATNLSKALARPDLVHLRVLNCAIRRMTPAFYTTLSTLETMASLEHLILGLFIDRDLDGFRHDASTLTGLMHLRIIKTYQSISIPALCELGRTPAMAHVTHLDIDDELFLGLDGDPSLDDTFPALERFTLRALKSEQIDYLPPDLQTLALAPGPQVYEGIPVTPKLAPFANLIRTAAREGVEHLDLSALGAEHVELSEEFMDYLEHADELTSFATVTYGTLERA